MLINIFLGSAGNLSRSLFIQVNGRTTQCKMVVFKFINEANGKIVANGKKLEHYKHQQNEDGIDLKATELPMDIFRKAEDREIIECLLQIKQEEIVDGVSRNIRISVEDHAGDQTENKVEAEADEGIFHGGLINAWEQSQPHGKNGDHHNQGVLQNKMHIPEAEGTRGKIGHQDRDKRTCQIGNEAELEQSLTFKGDRDEIQIRCQITKLNGKTGDREAHEIQRIVMEKQNDGQEYAKHIALTVGTESENKVKRKGDHR